MDGCLQAGIPLDEDAFGPQGLRILQQGAAKRMADVMSLILWRNRHFSQFITLFLRVIDQCAAADYFFRIGIKGKEYLAAIADDVAINGSERLPVRFFEPEPGLDPLRIQTDEIGLVFLLVYSSWIQSY